MADPRVKKLAKLLVNYSVQVEPGDTVAIRAGSIALPLVQEVYREVLAAGGHPIPIWSEPIFDELLLLNGNDDQLRYYHEPYRIPYQRADRFISIRGATNTRHLSGVEPAKQKIRAEARREIVADYMNRSAEGALRWVGTLFPTEAHAQDADMSLSDFEDFVYGACFADREDPVAAWRSLSKMQQKLVDHLKGKKEVVVKGPHVDLTLSIEGRTFINSDGQRNMPSGEIFTGPVEESVNGWIRYSYPAIFQGREVEGIELKFDAGRVVEASATKNEPYLISVLDTDPGARYLGEFAIGTNNGIQRFTRSILFDEKIGGTIHMAVGKSYPETGGKNNSAIHWDMICDMRAGGQIFIDGDLFYDSGTFKL